MKTTATFFDGQSSDPHLIEIKLDDIRHDLVFISPPFVGKRWNVKNVTFEKLDHCLEITHGEDTLEILKVVDKEFVATFITHLKTNGKLSIYHTVLFKKFSTHIAIFAGIVVLIVSGYFLAIPWVGEKVANMLPESFDEYLTNTFIVNYLIDHRIDSSKTKKIEEFAAKLDFKNSKSLKIYAIQSSTVNAFALPDGSIIIFTGLLDKMKSSEELVALLSHEVAHVNLRHSIQMIARNLAGYIFISVIFTDVNGIMAVISQNAENLQSLSYSRKFENEADELGFNLMLHNNVNPQGMITLFSGLESETSVVPEFLSTHPTTQNRIMKIQQRIMEKEIQVQVHSDLDTIFNRLKNS